MLLCIFAVYLLAVWIIFYKLKLATLNTQSKIVVFAIGLGIVATVFFMVQRFAPYTKDVYVQSFVVPMASQVNGRVSEVFVKENQMVEAGNNLFQIDPEPYRLAVEQLRAKLVAARQAGFGDLATLAAARQTVRGADAGIKQATDNLEFLKAGIETAKARLDKQLAQVKLDRANVERAEKLMAENAGSQQEIDTRRADRSVSEAGLIEAQQGLNQAAAALEVGQSQRIAAIAQRESAVATVRQAQVVIEPSKAFQQMAERSQSMKSELEQQIQSMEGESPANDSSNELATKREELGELEEHIQRIKHNEARAGEVEKYLQGMLANVKSLEAQLQRAEFDLEQTTVKAPTNGYVSNLQLTPGAFASPGSPLLSFVDSKESWMVAIITENGLGLVKPGDAVEVAIALYPGKIFHGEVQSVVWGVGQAQGVPSGTLPQITKTNGTQKYMVRLRLDDEDATAPLRQGSTAVAAIYTQNGSVLHVIRKVQVRIQSMLNYLYL